MPAAASFVDSAEKSASSMRDLASARLVTVDVRLSTVASRRFCCAPRLARSVATVWIASSRMPSAVEASAARSEEHTSELKALMRISYAVFCLKKTKEYKHRTDN